MIMTDYNGKRVVLYKNQPAEITQPIYNYLIESGHVGTVDLKVIVNKPIPENTDKRIEEPKKKEPKPKAKSKKK